MCKGWSLQRGVITIPKSIRSVESHACMSTIDALASTYIQQNTLEQSHVYTHTHTHTHVCRPARIVENLSVYDFELDQGDMRVLNGLHRDLRVTWDPTGVP